MTRDTSQEKGFTIVETLVATTVFSLVMMGIVGIFTQMLIIQRRGSAAQRIQENVQYVLELISREVRISTLATGQDANCAPATRSTLTINYFDGAGTSTIIYSVTPAGVVQRQESGVTADISSPEVQFTNFFFCVAGSDVAGQQPRVTIVASVKDLKSPAGDIVFHVQTLVTPRELDEP
ncbi:MAG: prepilin-type N-terminal cleavage/methylation domain-containing protein [Patescibacteria group bacterium]